LESIDIIALLAIMLRTRYHKFINHVLIWKRNQKWHH